MDAEVKKYHGFTREELQKIVDTGKCCRSVGECLDCFFQRKEDCSPIIKKWLEDNLEGEYHGIKMTVSHDKYNKKCGFCNYSKWYTASGFYECPDPNIQTNNLKECEYYKQYIPENPNPVEENPITHKMTVEFIDKFKPKPASDGYYYPTKDNLCKLDILTGNYVFEWQGEDSGNWILEEGMDALQIIQYIFKGNPLPYRFKLQKTKEQLIDEEIEEIIEENCGGKPVGSHIKDLMKICLNRSRK